MIIELQFIQGWRDPRVYVVAKSMTPVIASSLSCSDQGLMDYASIILRIMGS